MADLDRAVPGEVDASHDAAWGALDFSFAADVSGNHGGYLAGLSYGCPFAIGPVRVKPKVGIEWQSAEVVRWYSRVRFRERHRNRDRSSGFDGRRCGA